MIPKDENPRYVYAQSYLSLFHYPFNTVIKHTAYTFVVQLNNY